MSQWGFIHYPLDAFKGEGEIHVIHAILSGSSPESPECQTESGREEDYRERDTALGPKAPPGVWCMLAQQQHWSHWSSRSGSILWAPRRGHSSTKSVEPKSSLELWSGCVTRFFLYSLENPSPYNFPESSRDTFLPSLCFVEQSSGRDLCIYGE